MSKVIKMNQNKSNEVQKETSQETKNVFEKEIERYENYKKALLQEIEQANIIINQFKKIIENGKKEI